MAFSLDLGNLLVHLSLKTAQFDRMLKTSERKLLNIAGGMQRVGRTMTMGLTLPIVGIGAAAVKSFASFDDAMTKSTAIMGNLSKEMRSQLEKTALTISKKSVTSARELARSYFYLASAGLDAQQSLAALPVVEKFAVAGAFDMALATDLVTDAQSALGMTMKDNIKNMQNMNKVANVLIGANTLANATTEQFSRSLTTEAAAAMKAYNIELEEGVAVLAAYADQGIKSERAGSLFGRMLRLTISGFQKNRQAWKQFKVDIYDANRNLKPLNQIISDLSGALEGMSTEQRAATLDMLGFQARSQQAILPLLGLGDAVKDYRDQLRGMQGILDEINEKQLQSFSAQMRILWNNVVSVGIEIGEELAPKVLALNKQIKDGLQWWEKLNKETKSLAVNIGLVVAAIGPVLLVLGTSVKLLALMKVGLVAIGGATFGALGAVVIGFAALVSGIEAAIDPSKTFMDSWKGFWEKQLEGIKAVTVDLKTLIQAASDWADKRRNLVGAPGDFGTGPNARWQPPEAGRVTLPSGRTPRENQAIAERNNFMLEAQQAAAGWLEEESLLTEQLQKQAEVVQSSLEPQRSLLEKFGEAIEAHSTTFHTYLTNATDTWNRLGEVGASAVDGLSDALSQLATTGKADMKKLALSVLTELNRMIIKMLVAKAIMSALGISPMPGAGGAPIGGAGGAVAPTVTPSAMGNLFSANRIVPFQRGGMINGPTVFPLADNTLGVAGERGKEMLAPVTRMPTGEMGVKSQPSPTVVNLKAVNVFDKSEIVGAMDSEEGEKVLLNIMRRKGLI